MDDLVGATLVRGEARRIAVASGPDRSQERSSPTGIWSSGARTRGTSRSYDHGVSMRSSLAAYADVLIAGVLGTLYVVEVLFSGELTA